MEKKLFILSKKTKSEIKFNQEKLLYLDYFGEPNFKIKMASKKILKNDYSDCMKWAFGDFFNEENNVFDINEHDIRSAVKATGMKYDNSDPDFWRYFEYEEICDIESCFKTLHILYKHHRSEACRKGVKNLLRWSKSYS